jgi:hypothetical protein
LESPDAVATVAGDRATPHLPYWKVRSRVSSMESEIPPRDPSHALADLAAADGARERLASGLRLPAGLHPVLAVAVALQIGAGAVGIAEQTTAGMAAVLGGLVVLFAVTAWAVLRFRQINGVRVDGFASQIVLGTGVTASTTYVAAFVAATWAAFEAAWWVVLVAAVCGGAGYAWGARQWWLAFGADPAGHADGASPRVLALLLAATCLGLAVLMIAG